MREDWNNNQKDAFDVAFSLGALRDPETARADNYRQENYVNDAMADLAVKQQNLLSGYKEKIFRQAELVNGLSRISPNMVFRLAVSEVAGTSFSEIRSFHDQADRYRRILFDRLREADRKDESTPNLVYLGLFWADRVTREPFDSSLPEFSFQTDIFTQRIVSVSQDLMILVSCLALFYLAGTLAFNRYDVR